MRVFAIAAPILLSAPLLAQNVVLDDFASDPNGQAGGPRELSSVINANPYGQSSSFDLLAGFVFGEINGAVVFNSGIGVEQVGTINWDNNDAGLNFDATSFTGFELDFLQIDQSFGISLLLESDSGGSASYSTTIGPAASLTTYAFAVGDFDTVGGFDFSDVDSITITFNGSEVPASTASLDFIMTEFRAVPSPATAGLLGLGGLVATRRRRG